MVQQFPVSLAIHSFFFWTQYFPFFHPIPTSISVWCSLLDPDIFPRSNQPKKTQIFSKKISICLIVYVNAIPKNESDGRKAVVITDVVTIMLGKRRKLLFLTVSLFILLLKCIRKETMPKATDYFFSGHLHKNFCVHFRIEKMKAADVVSSHLIPYKVSFTIIGKNSSKHILETAPP